MSWIVDRLQNLAGTVDDQAKADLDVDCDQPAMLRDLEQIARVISLRLGQACPSPQACSSQTSDVRYVVPPMFAQYRSVPHGLDPREDASSWADVVTRRDPPAHRDGCCNPDGNAEENSEGLHLGPASEAAGLPDIPGQISARQLMPMGQM